LVSSGDRKNAVAVVTRFPPVQVKNGARLRALEASLAALSMPSGSERPTKEEDELALQIVVALDVEKPAAELIRWRLRIDANERLGHLRDGANAIDQLLASQANKLTPEETDVFNLRLGKLRLRLDQPAEAGQALLRIRPTAAQAFEGLQLRGEALWASAQWVAAIDVLSQVLASPLLVTGSPEAQRCRLRLAESHARAGQTKEAASILAGVESVADELQPLLQAARTALAEAQKKRSGDGVPPSRPDGGK
jgi:hypothetical protein